MAEIVIENWDDVDLNLRKLGEQQIARSKVEGEFTLRVNEIKEEKAKSLEGVDLKIKEVQEAIEAFAKDNKAEFTKKRSKELNFGKISFKVSTKLTGIPRVKDKLEKLINTIKSYGFVEAIKTVETIDKDFIAESLSNSEMAKLGLKKTTTDNFKVEANIEKIEQTA